ncbi:MAG: hypothetical protein SOZ42_01105 [Candidatus Enterosoma sp.]|nr:hypothetical protein [Candidatus Enterosoma sp.]
MTDKEWKELCGGAERLDYDRIEVEYNKVLDERTIYIKSVAESYLYDRRVGLEINQDGSIYNGRVYIAENRTAKQIKAILENLVEEV